MRLRLVRSMSAFVFSTIACAPAPDRFDLSWSSSCVIWATCLSSASLLRTSLSYFIVSILCSVLRSESSLSAEIGPPAAPAAAEEDEEEEGEAIGTPPEEEGDVDEELDAVRLTA